MAIGYSYMDLSDSYDEDNSIATYKIGTYTKKSEKVGLKILCMCLLVVLLLLLLCAILYGQVVVGFFSAILCLAIRSIIDR